MKTPAAKKPQSARLLVQAAASRQFVSPAAPTATHSALGQAPLTWPDDSPALTAQRELQESVHASPRQTAQVAQLARLRGQPLQRAQEEKEPLPGRFDTVQRQDALEEEEPLQGKFATLQRVEEEEEPLQGQFETAQRQSVLEEEEPLQGKFEATGPIQRAEENAKPNQTGLPDNLKNGIESLSGRPMDNVKVHYNSSQPAQLNALAYAQGTDIHVPPGQEKHLPHEAWHVVQQAQGRVEPTMQMKQGVPVNDDKSLEHEADVMGRRTHREGALTQCPSPAQRRVKLTRDQEIRKGAGGAVAQLKLTMVLDGWNYTPSNHVEFKRALRVLVQQAHWLDLHSVLRWFINEQDYERDDDNNNPPHTYDRTLLKAHCRSLLRVVYEALALEREIEALDAKISRWKGIARWVYRIGGVFGTLGAVGGGILQAITGTWFRSSVTAVALPPMTIEGLPVGSSGNATFAGTFAPINNTTAFRMSGFVIDQDQGRQPVNVTIVPGEIGPQAWVPLVEGVSQIALYGGTLITIFTHYISKNLVEPKEEVKEREAKKEKMDDMKRAAEVAIAD